MNLDLEKSLLDDNRLLAELRLPLDHLRKFLLKFLGALAHLLVLLDLDFQFVDALEVDGFLLDKDLKFDLFAFALRLDVLQLVLEVLHALNKGFLGFEYQGMSRLDFHDLDMLMHLNLVMAMMLKFFVGRLLDEFTNSSLLDNLENLLFMADLLDGHSEGFFGTLQNLLALVKFFEDFLLFRTLCKLQAPSKVFDLSLLVDDNLFFILDDLSADDNFFLFQSDESAFEMFGAFALFLQTNDLPLDLVNLGD